MTAKIEAPAYSRNPEFIGSAFSLYCKGLSIERVCDALRPQWPDAAPRTVQRIAKENGWEKSRASYLKLYQDAAASAEGLVPQVILNLQRICTQLESRARMTTSEMFAYRALSEDLMWYTGKHPRLKDGAPLAVSSEAELQAFLKAIQSDEVVGPAWRRRRAQIEKAYRGELEKAEQKQKAATDGQRAAGIKAKAKSVDACAPRRKA